MFLKVSIIVPCYNQAEYLPETLDSVLAQTYKNWECIIVNDGSTDNTEEVALKYCKQDERFVYLPKQNGGLSSARNAGLDVTKGDYVQFLDSDDILLPTKIEKQVHLLENEETDVCVCHHSMFTTDVNQNWENKFSQSVYDLTYQGFMYNWGESFVIAIHSGLFRKVFIDKNNLRFDTCLGAFEDWLFWLNIIRNGGRFCELVDKMVLYRVHTASMTQDKSHMQKNRLRLYFRIYEMLSDQEKLEFMQYGMDNLVAYFERVNRNQVAEKGATSIDYKVGAFLLYPLHKLSSWLKHL